MSHTTTNENVMTDEDQIVNIHTVEVVDEDDNLSINSDTLRALDDEQNNEEQQQQQPAELNNTQELLDDLGGFNDDEDVNIDNYEEKPHSRKYSQIEDDDDVLENLDLTDLSPIIENPLKKQKFDQIDENNRPVETFGFVSAKLTSSSKDEENISSEKPPATDGFVSAASNRPSETFGFVSASSNNRPAETFGFVSARPPTKYTYHPEEDDEKPAATEGFVSAAPSKRPPETFGFMKANGDNFESETEENYQINKPAATDGFVSASTDKPSETFGFISASSNKPPATDGFVTAGKDSKKYTYNPEEDEKPPATDGFVSAASNNRPVETFGFVSARPPTKYTYNPEEDDEKPPATEGFVSAKPKTKFDSPTEIRPSETFGFVSARPASKYTYHPEEDDEKPAATEGFVSASNRPSETFGFVSASSNKPAPTDGFVSASNRTNENEMDISDERPPATDGFQSALDRPPPTEGFLSASNRPPETFGFLKANTSTPAETDGFQVANNRPPATDGFVSSKSSSTFKTPSKNNVNIELSTPSNNSDIFKTPSKVGSSLNKKTPATKRSIKNPFASLTTEQGDTKKETPTNRINETVKKKQKKFVTPIKSKESFEEAKKRESERRSASTSSSSSISITKKTSDTTPITAPSWVPVKHHKSDSKEEVHVKRRINTLGICEQLPIEKIKREGVSQYSITMTSISAKTFKFNLNDFKVSNEMIEAIVSLNGNKRVVNFGSEEYERLLVHFGAKTSVVKTDWVENHYRWIVWKLASLDRTFPNDKSFPFLTPEKVLGQLIYRYNVEFCKGKRSCLKMIAEKDIPPGQFMVLMVSSLSNNDNDMEECKTIELSDGWYSMKAKLDEQLSRYLEWCKIRIGQKLRIVGASFVENFEPAPPLELPGNACLKLSINGVRKAHWDTTLGFQYGRMPFKVSFKSIQSNGGNIPCIRAIVKRVYPQKFLEKITDESGTVSTIIRTKQAEDYISAINEKEREKLMATLQPTYYDEEKKKIIGPKKNITTPIKRIYEGSVLYKLLSECRDESSFYAQLNETQHQNLENYQRNIESEIQSRVSQRLTTTLDQHPTLNRNVSAMVTVRLGDCCPYSKNPGVTMNDKEMIITLWIADEDNESFQEGNIIDIYNSRSSKQSGSQVMKSISAISHTKVEIVKNWKDLTDEEMKVYSYVPRSCINFTQVKNPDCRQHNNEFDFAGILVYTKEIEQREKESTLKLLYFVDSTSFNISESSYSKNPIIMQVRYYESNKKQFRWFLTPGKVYYMANVTYSDFDETNNRIKCFANEQTFISERATKQHFKSASSEINAFLKNNREKCLSLESVIDQFSFREEDYTTPRKSISSNNDMEDDFSLDQEINCNPIIDGDHQIQITLLDGGYNVIETYVYPKDNNISYKRAEDTYSFYVKLYIETKEECYSIKFTEDMFDKLANCLYFEEANNAGFHQFNLQDILQSETIPEWIKTLVIADGFPSSSSSYNDNNNNNITFPSSTTNPSTISSLLLERNQFYRKLAGVNRSNSTSKLLDRNFCCILPHNLSLGDVKQTICRQYQSIFYDKVTEGFEFDNSDAFTLSRLYSDLGLELGLWNTQLKASDIFTDEQVVFAKLDCSRKQKIKLKEKYQQTEQYLSPPDSDKEQSNTALFETPKKRKPTSNFLTPQSKKKKPITPPSITSGDDSDSSVSDSEDEAGATRPVTSATLKQTAENPIVIQSDEESEESEEEEEEEETPVKKPQPKKQELKQETKKPEKKQPEKEESEVEDSEEELKSDSDKDVMTHRSIRQILCKYQALVKGKVCWW
ncbi:predicted protein [Naegleria gruberi]|uniref:Predicted protein n=1 Tax=Naegleria gruberi TaxID=5762 RepID=D2UYY4_NAEGR|nr:uncharacterized protein NAEGRDRAFT_45350 [Naegleria gruberi]EFC49856.1 predicted protein [Naegleria gruberi]|eukprot:XP_002682600.1 predicted protein [Naegleria gruberi strain NEG-M]